MLIWEKIRSKVDEWIQKETYKFAEIHKAHFCWSVWKKIL